MVINPDRWRALRGAPKEIERIVVHGVKANWLQTQDGHSVALTEAGRGL